MPRCGTQAGRIAHYRRGEPACDLCRAAQNAYKRRWRKEPAKRESERLRVRANTRAVWRLAELYPDDFRRLNNEERNLLGLPPTGGVST
jgi:hypothetical protein